MTAQRIAMQHLLHLQRQRGEAFAHVGVARRQPHPNSRRDRNHRRSRTSMRRPSASTSMPASTMIRRPLVNSISIRRSVEYSVALRDESAAGGTGPSSATTALTKPGSDFARSAAKAFRHVTSSERDRPYRRAVAATRRGSDRLSKTIRAFSSSDQRRRRPVSTTSSRFSALIVWLSIHTVLNHQAVRRKASLLGGLHQGCGPPKYSSTSIFLFSAVE